MAATKAPAALPAWFQSGNGSPVDNVTPAQAGAVYYDTTNGGIYSAVGTTDTDWISLGGVGNIGSATGLSLLAGDTYLLTGDRDDPDAKAYVGSAYAQWNGHSQGLTLNFGAGEGNENFVLRAGSTGQFTATLLDGLGQSVFPGQTTIQGPLIVSSLAAPAELQNSQAALYFNDNDGAPSLKIIAKTANGTVVTGEVALA